MNPIGTGGTKKNSDHLPGRVGSGIMLFKNFVRPPVGVRLPTFALTKIYLHQVLAFPPHAWVLRFELV